VRRGGENLLSKGLMKLKENKLKFVIIILKKICAIHTREISPSSSRRRINRCDDMILFSEFRDLIANKLRFTATYIIVINMVCEKLLRTPIVI
jgi:hypothetical protein